MVKGQKVKAVTRNLFREISKTKNRFFSIFTICAIGVGFFSGVRATENDMRITSDNYYDSHELFDVRVMSSFGLTDDDLKALAELDGVDNVQASKYTDLTLSCDGKDYNTRVYSIGENDTMNLVDLTDGRMPQAEDECIINSSKLKEGMEIGSTVTLSDSTNADEFPLKHTEYTIVGTFDTPMYISSTQRGSTTIGNGSLQAFLYVNESNFTQEVYTEIYLQSNEMKAAKSYSDEYEALRDSLEDKLETLGAERSEIRYDEVIGDAEQEIADGEKELEDAKTDGQKELDDAKAKLDDAAVQIEDAEKKLSDAKAELEDGETQLEDAKQQLADAKTEIDSGWEKVNANQEKLDEAEQTLSDSQKQLTSAKTELDKAKATLDESKKKLDDGQAEIDSNRAALEESKTQLEQGKQQLADAQTQYDEGLAAYNTSLEEYNKNLEEYNKGVAAVEQLEAVYGSDNEQVTQQKTALETAKTQLDAAKTQLNAAKAQLDEAKAQIDANSATLEESEKQITEAEAKLDAAQQEIDEGTAQYEEGLKQYNESYAQYEDGVKQYNEGYAEYADGVKQLNEARNTLKSAEQEYNDGLATITEKEQELSDGKQEYEDGVKELEDAKKEYNDGLKEYEDGVETFNTEIADAEKKIADAKQEIEDAGEAKWYIFNRDDNPGYSEYSSNAERIGKIASIFPLFFLLVAALVCLTTMSRMVEEQRMQIGTLKSLGYSNPIIMRQYMLYAVIAALTGSLVGAFIGMFLFPYIIMFAYSMMYIITNFYFELSPSNIILSAGSMVAAIALTVFFTARKALRETPAELMRPKAPKAGKRVLLEKIGFIWNHLSFFGKVSGRNLFRYKRRMFMTVIGIAGCTALSLTGFGLKDSIGDIVDLQYNDINKYSGYIAYDADDTDADGLQAIYDELTDYNPDTQYTRALIKQYTLSSDSANVQCYVTAVEDTDIIEDMIDFRDRKTGEKLSFDTAEGGTIITEKLTKLLDVKTGDKITLRISDSESQEVTVGAITEHYASHYMYISQEKYTELFGEEPQFNIIYFYNGISADDAEQDEFTEKMLAVDGVLSVQMNAGASSNFSNMLKIMDLVVVVLIVSAGALAFVVLYNLTNVNITERIREIATLKVLGFYDKEVSSYVFRENNLLSVMGAVIGLDLGVALCQFIIQTAEIDEVMFGRNIHPLSFVWAFVITVAFSLIVNMIMRRDLKRISMVESLKSVE